MLKISKIARHTTTQMSGCSKTNQINCGVTYRMG